jgi:hypothetical protein
MTMPIKLSTIYLKHRAKQTMDAGAGRTESLMDCSATVTILASTELFVSFFRLALTTVYKHCKSLQPEQVATSTTNVQFALDRR